MDKVKYKVSRKKLIRLLRFGHVGYRIDCVGRVYFKSRAKTDAWIDVPQTVLAYLRQNTLPSLLQAYQHGRGWVKDAPFEIDWDR
jgi:hypothetical protein